VSGSARVTAQAAPAMRRRTRCVLSIIGLLAWSRRADRCLSLAGSGP
jgi:hypothetical protein